MKIGGRHYRSIELTDNKWSVTVIDQRRLPWEVLFVELKTCEEAAQAIREMWVRGAPLIGAVAAYGFCLALRQDASDAAIDRAYDFLFKTRPTAINLKWALDHMRQAVVAAPVTDRVSIAYNKAASLCDEDVAINLAIGKNGLDIIKALSGSLPSARPLQILTHCNAGWLATVDYGTALAPLYLAHDAGIPVHVWVDETRPRNQGASLTAWELQQYGIPHTVITDNAGALLMSQKKVDFCIVGADRVTRNGDVCNKIGTYLKALAAQANQVPFYVALPSSTIDFTLANGAGNPYRRTQPRRSHPNNRPPGKRIDRNRDDNAVKRL